MVWREALGDVIEMREHTFWYYRQPTVYYFGSFFFFFFFLILPQPPFPFADAYSSLILQLGPGQLSDPVFLIWDFFPQWKFYVFSELHTWNPFLFTYPEAL